MLNLPLFRMVLPLSLIQTAVDHPMLVELKNGKMKISHPS